MIHGDESVVVGKTVASETKFPSIKSIISKPYVLIDMPGFNDNRETTNESGISPQDIATAMSVYWLAKRVKQVRALFAFVPHAQFKDINFSNDLKQTFQNVGRMILEHPESADNIRLIITQYESINAPKIVARMRTLANSEQAKKDPALSAFFDAFKINPEQKIIFFDVIDPAFRQTIYDILDDIKPKSTQDFDFEHCSKHLERFKDLLEQFTESSQVLKVRISSIENAIQKFESFANREQRTEQLIQALNVNKLPSLADSVSMSELRDVQRSLITFLDNMQHMQGLSLVLESLEEKYKSNNARCKELEQLQIQLEVEEVYYQDLGVFSRNLASSPSNVVRMSPLSIFKISDSANKPYIAGINTKGVDVEFNF